ncbi:MAG: TMEM165/GDT1 family protein [Streptosporangiaceae bacterium]
MSLAAVITSFLIILLAELPDKTVIACLVLGSRYRPGYVFAGAAAAFAIQVALAVTVGGLLSLLPHRPTQVAVAALFVVGAVLLLRQRPAHSDEYVAEHKSPRAFLPVALTSFAVVFAAEFGDLTQIVTANLAVKYHDPLSVAVGAVAALWVAAGVAIVGGRGLLKVIPVQWLSRGAAAIMLALAGLTVAALF